MSARHVIKDKDFLFESETINSDYTSKSVRVGTSIQSFVVAFSWDNGVGPIDMNLRLEASSDNVNFGIYTDYIVNVFDTDGVIIFDVADSGAEFVRVSIVHVSGTIDATCIKTLKKAI